MVELLSLLIYGWGSAVVHLRLLTQDSWVYQSVDISYDNRSTTVDYHMLADLQLWLHDRAWRKTNAVHRYSHLVDGEASYHTTSLVKKQHQQHQQYRLGGKKSQAST